MVAAFQHVSGLYRGEFGNLGNDSDRLPSRHGVRDIHQKRYHACWQFNRFGLFTIGDALPDLCLAPLITRQELPDCTCDAASWALGGNCL